MRSLDDDRFTGSIDGLPFLDLLQVLNRGKRAVVIELEHCGEHAVVGLKAGEVIHATVGSRAGVPRRLRLPVEDN